jgi:transcriptional regulator with XRE-family HTH domain
VFALHKRGLKQRLIAEEVGITQVRVSQILNGRLIDKPEPCIPLIPALVCVSGLS